MKAALTLCFAFALVSSAFGRDLLQDGAAPTASISVSDVLNFALNLEYLEAEFYSCAATGSPLPAELRGGGPPSQGCRKASLGPVAQGIAEEIARNEIAHVTLLRQALGSQAVPIPQLNIGTAFADAADAAFGETVSPRFSPYLNDLFFYHGAFIFEDVGVTAYAGAAPLIKDSAYLQPAAEILAVEAYHGGIIRTLLFQNRDAATPYNVTVAEVIQAISNLRNSADGAASDDDQGIETAQGQPNLVPTNDNGLVFARTPAEVLNIVTLGKGRNGGGFFPQGLNGAFGRSGSSTVSNAGR